MIHGIAGAVTNSSAPNSWGEMNFGNGWNRHLPYPDAYHRVQVTLAFDIVDFQITPTGVIKYNESQEV